MEEFIIEKDELLKCNDIGEKTVVVPDNIKIIGDRAFRNHQADEVHLPLDLTKIEKFAFQGSAIRSCNIPDKVEVIEEAAFVNCKWLSGSAVIPASVKELGLGVFSECDSLEKAFILAKLDYLPPKTFELSHGLKSVILPHTCKVIGKEAFFDCSALERVNTEALENLDRIEEYAFSGCAKLQRIIIPDSVTYIAKSAFCGCASADLVMLGMPETSKLKTIEHDAFRRCKNLSEIVIPASVEHIGNFAFYRCENLEHIVFSRDEQLNFLERGEPIFRHCQKLRWVESPSFELRKDDMTGEWTYGRKR